MMQRRNSFTKTIDGNSPVQEFLDSLSGKVAQKVLWTLTLLEDFEFVPAIYFKKLNGAEGSWECQIQYGSNIYRIFCFFDSSLQHVITAWFSKEKSENTTTKTVKQKKIICRRKIK